MDCTSGEAGRRGPPQACAAARCQAMRAGIVEFGGVQEEEEEENPENPGPTWAKLGPTWGHCTEGSAESAWHLLAKLGHISRQVSSPEECVAPAISCQKDLEVWQNLWPAWPC